MNKGRLIGGIICMAVAALLAVLILTLPQGEFVFMMGESNVPWVPVFILAGAGAALAGTAQGRQEA